MINIKYKKIAVLGLGYVGLPLAIEFGKVIETIGYDVSKKRINQLKSRNDLTLEVSKKEFKQSKKLKFTYNLTEIADANIYIVTVPTPIYENKRPDLRLIKKATKDVAKVITKNNVIIYESTVYPGVTEEVCIPLIEKISGLKLNKDFYCGYSPERINPGDKKHKLSDIVKITSGSNRKSSIFIDKLYKLIIKAGTYSAPSIKVAEAAKVIENTQRDLNIGLINELSLIFDRMKIDTKDVLKAASTKWNFLNFEPGLVGGHCIGVDPYYLTYQSKKLGYEPQIILSARNLNDKISRSIVNKIIRISNKKKINLNKSKTLILGYSFKENCPDHRNTKVKDLVSDLETRGSKVYIYDPWIKDFESDKVKKNFIDKPVKNKYDLIIIAVKHNQYKKMGIKTIREFGKKNSIIYDIKSLFKRSEVDGRL